MAKAEPLTTDALVPIYALGFFPMGDQDGELQMYRPFQRAVFPIEGIHVSRSLRKVLDRKEFEVRFDADFEITMRACLRAPGDNWITEELIEVFCQAHREGWAHSVEVYRDGELAGGLYGLAIGTLFCAESMFHRQTNASKVALYHAVEKCRELGFTIFDAQVMNPHLESMGAIRISDRAYRKLLQKALEGQTAWSYVSASKR
jgi:leucyl/phenylalanyl-tRNA---protein transferase